MANTVRMAHVASVILALGVAALTASLVPLDADARPDYRAMIDETGAFLSEAIGQYRRGDIQAAKSKAEAAYFEVYENLEGPIRINISAKRNYELEQEFLAIRKMIVDEAPAETIEKRVNDFMAELKAVVPVLEAGVDLLAESSHVAEQQGRPENSPGADGIEPVWRQAFHDIQAGLGTALETYRKGEAKRAADLVIQTQYDHYKNSLFETAVRRHVSQKENSQNNSGFSDIIGMMHSATPVADVERRVSGLLASLLGELPGLPLVEGVASAGHAGTSGTANPAEKDWGAVTADLLQEINEATALYANGDQQGAITRLQDAYFDVFEASGMETKLSARDANSTANLEAHFSKIVAQMKSGTPVEETEGAVTSLRERIAAAAATLAQAKDSPTALFFYSLMILLREGIEAILILTAIIAYLIKTGNTDKLRVIYSGCITALILSGVTALLVKWALTVSAASQEVLEGATMLVASVVLFGVSYWLISKAEAQRWLAYIRSKVGTSLSSNSLRALWLAAFLAVYREGAETVLFYQALVSGSTPSGITATAAGFAVGCTALVALYLGMRYGAVRLPLRPFFLFTGALLYYMSFVFAGKGVMELIEGKLLEPTLISWIPAVPFVGVFPYVQTLLPQLLIVLAALAAAALMRRQRSVPAREAAHQ